MGKTRQRKKIRGNRMKFAGRPSTEDNDLEEEAEINGSNNSGDTLVQSIIEQVQSVNCEAKLCGLQILATVFEDQKSIDELIKHKVIKMVGPLLLDKSSEVRCCAAGALRNLSTCGSIEISERLVQEDVMTPLVTLILQFRDWRPETLNDSEKKESTDTLIHGVNLLWNLCQIDETAVKYFNSSNILDVLLRPLDFDIFGLDLAIAACQCLHTVSEDNAGVISKLQNYETQLLALVTLQGVQPKQVLLQTLAAGLMINISCSVKYLSSILSSLVKVLNVDQRELLSKLSSDLPLDKGIELASEVQENLDNTTALIDAQTIALEIITNIYTSQDDEAQEDSDDTISDEMDDDENWCDMDTTQSSAMSSELCEAVSKYSLLQVAFKKLNVPAENVCSILQNNEDAKGLLKKINTLRCRACLCLNNLVSMVDMEDLGGPDYLYLVWTFLGETIVKQSSEDGDVFLEAATTAMRAVVLRLASIQYIKLRQLSSADLDILLKIGCSTKDSNVRANIIRTVATLGTLFANDNCEMTKIVGTFLIEISEKETKLWVIAEALDAIMDVFSEDSTDRAAYESCLIKRLNILAPTLRNKLKQEQKKSGEHHALMSTVARNLNRFIRYKGARLKHYEPDQ